jgi:putative transposase
VLVKLCTSLCSDGEAFEAPKPLKAKLALLKRRSKSVSRKVKKSKNRWKAVRKLAKVHADVKNIRQDWIHKVTTKIARKHHTVCLEDLNVKGMMKNHKLARAISDIGFYEIRRQLEYKVPLYGGEVKIISRWEPSTKRCSNCGSVKDTIALSERVFDCPKCGFSLDRDLNAARNIMTVGLAVTACGPKSSGNVHKNVVKLCRDEAGTRPRAQSLVRTN